MACKDWIGSLRRASYRGVSFYVETDQIATGRRLVVHEFPHRDTPYVEDLGRKANTISVTAYLHGDNVGAAEGSLRRACDAGGPARLNLPMARTVAHCQDCSRSYKKDQLGYIAFELKFVVEGSRPAPFNGLNSARAVEFAGSRLVASVEAAFSATFAGIGVPGFVLDAAVADIRNLAASLDVAAREAPIEPDAAAELLAAAADMAIRAPTLAAVGDVGDRYSRASFVSTATVVSAEFVTALGAFFERARKAQSPEYATGFLEPWLSYSVERPPAISASLERQAANAAAIERSVRALAAAQYAAAAALREYRDRREATQARADVAELFEGVLAGLNGWAGYAATVEITDIRNSTVNLLTRIMTDLAPILTVESPRRMPSLWWANRLYGDANRAAELVARNRVKHGAFMPAEFEALAR